MPFNTKQTWTRFQKLYFEFPALGLSLDLSRMNVNEDFADSNNAAMQPVFEAMARLENGEEANVDEKRMVGHYWLRNPLLAPQESLRREIEECIQRIKVFTSEVHTGRIRGAGGPFKNLLLIGIGGSALGPQFVSRALSQGRQDTIKPYYLDNTDPDGIDNVLKQLEPELAQTLTIVVSKSGSTKETRNGMLETQAAYLRANLDFGRHTVAITSVRSDLDKLAVAEDWLARFPMWDWVGGRTSETSAVGLLPAALQGFDIDSLLAGAAACDELTRNRSNQSNPAALLSLAWRNATNENGRKAMVILPYKDRLELFAKYLQQLIMESLGKELDLNGRPVHEGITVYGNKGSTDQHAYVQQLRDGPNNFFVTFLHVRDERQGESMEVEPQITSGDYLHGFLLGTRDALFEKERESIMVSVEEVNPFSIGVMIALYERAVGFYASLTNINAYHQPGVEAGKKGASAILAQQLKVMEFLKKNAGKSFRADQIAKELELSGADIVFRICDHLAANGRCRKIRRTAPTLAEFVI